MNKTPKILALALLGGMASLGHAESSLYGGMMGTWIDPDNARTNNDDEALGGQLLFGFPFNPYLAGELSAFGLQLAVNGGGNIQNLGLGGDLVLTPMPNSALRPFLLAGGGGTYEEALRGAGQDASDRIVGYADAGGGLLYDLGGPRHTALRLEGRRYAIFSDDFATGNDRIYDTRISAGVQFNLVADAPPPPPPPPPPPAVSDSDRDGVPDYLDRCPGTPAGMRVDSYGCPLPPPPPRDSDGDGVIDASDACPDTPRGMRVDERGCAIKAQRLVLRNINFEFNKATLTPDGRAILDGIAAGLRGQPTMEVEIEGHTDYIGANAYNLKLSKGRASSVRDYLISQGVLASRLSAQGYGESRPVASNKTDAGRAENRRVEFKVIQQ